MSLVSIEAVVSGSDVGADVCGVNAVAKKPEMTNGEAQQPAEHSVASAGLAADGVAIIEPTGSVTDAPTTEPEYEVIGGYRVHRLASRFPLIVGKEFDELVGAAARAGRLQAVEVHGGLLIDGRNRLRVQEELRRRGIEIDLPVVEWEPSGDESVEEHIWSVNANRRHLTDDQRAAIGISFLPFIQRSSLERQAATRFGQRGPVEEISSPPEEPAATPRRTSRNKDEASSVGQFAAMCRIGIHKARQAVALADGVEVGEISSVEIVAVATGEKRLRDVVPGKRSSGGRKPNRDPHSTTDRAGDLTLVATSGAALDVQIDHFLLALMDEVPVTEHREMCHRLKCRITEMEQQRGW